MNTSNWAVIGGGFLGLLTLLTIGFFLFLGYRFLFRNSNIFGESLKIRVVALGITAFFFPYGIRMVFFEPIQILFTDLSVLFASIQELSVTGRSESTEISLAKMLAKVFSDRVDKYDISRILISLAAWSLVGQLINTSRSNASPAGGTQGYSARRQHFMLAGIFALSIYLFLASIIAIPYFMENKEDDLKAESLKVRLDQVDDVYKARMILDVQKEPNFEIDSVLERQTARDSSDPDKARQFYTEVRSRFALNIDRRRALEQKIEDEKQEMRSELDALRSKLINTYAIYAPSLKTKLKLAYINSLSEYYGATQGAAIEKVDKKRRFIHSSDGSLKEDLQKFGIDLAKYRTMRAQAYPGPQPSQSLPEMRLIRMDYYYFEWSRPASDESEVLVLVPPSVPRAGDELGIFRPISQWLIMPNSMSLVLIVGMLGFGLFGAGVSTFVKESMNKAKSKTAEVFIQDIGGIIVRGFSAAIVIFLAVKGGLAIFSSGSGDPNPYALFFTCLIGAVYSERIWEWARQKLVDNLRAQEDKKRETEVQAKLEAQPEKAALGQPESQAQPNPQGKEPEDKKPATGD